MRIKLFKTLSEKLQEYKTWQKVFAWFPKEIDGEIVWLEYLERQRYASWSESWWVYRLPENDLGPYYKDKK